MDIRQLAEDIRDSAPRTSTVIRDYQSKLWATAYLTVYEDCAGFSVDLGRYTVRQFTDGWHVFEGAKDVTSELSAYTVRVLTGVAVEYKLGIR